MKTSAFIKKPIYSALIFFGTLGVLSAGYAGFVTLQTSDADSGKSLTSTMMQAVIGNLADLDTRVSAMSGAVSSLQVSAGNPWGAVTGGIGYSGGNVGIGTTNPSDTLTVNGGVSATKFTTTTTWTVPTGNATWNYTNLSCRRVGSFLQFKGYISVTSSSTTGWGITLPNLPASCSPSVDLTYISAICWTDSATSPCIATVSSAGLITVWNNSTFKYISFAGSYPAN